MTPGAIAILSLGMSTDAFAAAVGRGAARRPDPIAAAKAGLVFGAIEAATPVIGWALGLVAAGFVQRVDHWIAFTLLCAVGINMLCQSLGTDAGGEDDGAGGPWALIATAIGTSIDAAAVGVGLAFPGANIWVIAAAIGVTTFAATTVGMMIGRAVGSRFGKVAEGIGGVALVGLGLGILLDHLGYLG